MQTEQHSHIQTAALAREHTQTLHVRPTEWMVTVCIASLHTRASSMSPLHFRHERQSWEHYIIEAIHESESLTPFHWLPSVCGPCHCWSRHPHRPNHCPSSSWLYTILTPPLVSSVSAVSKRHTCDTRRKVLGEGSVKVGFFWTNGITQPRADITIKKIQARGTSDGTRRWNLQKIEHKKTRARGVKQHGERTRVA